MDGKDIHWLGDSNDVIRTYSRPVRQKFGLNLTLLQMGKRPLDARRIKTIGRGVWELRVSDSGQYRLVYVVRGSDGIYVLHVFHKKTQRTSAKDVNLAKQRFKEI